MLLRQKMYANRRQKLRLEDAGDLTDPDSTSELDGSPVGVVDDPLVVLLDDVGLLVVVELTAPVVPPVLSPFAVVKSAVDSPNGGVEAIPSTEDSSAGGKFVLFGSPGGGTSSSGAVLGSSSGDPESPFD
jgi:hypothetical protein